MARLPLALPPGVVRNGTNYQSKGRYYDAYGTRWYPALGPIGGWRERDTTGDTIAGAPRAALVWKDNAIATRLLVGTDSNLYVMDRTNVVSDITPVGFTAGRPDAVTGGGYGSGPYGAGTYGTPRPDTSQIQDATQWTLDTWGQTAIGVSPDDGKIYQTQADPTDPVVQVTNSPTCYSLVVTEQGFLFALGADGDPRSVAWCDQRNITLWAPDATNQAGDFAIQTAGRLMTGKRVKGGTLVFTELDVHLASFIGGTAVHGFEKMGDSCGVISRQAVATFDQQAAWMGTSGFWLWNGGGVVPLECEVLDYVFADFNRLQQSKVWAQTVSEHSEIEFRYCSGSSNEIDRCAVWNYKYNYWTIGRVSRTCGVDRGIFQYPIMIDVDGMIFDHEVANDMDGETPYARGGPIELGNGDFQMEVLGLYPDDKTVGDVTASFTVRRNMDDVGTELGPYSLTSQTDLRISGGLVEVTYTGAAQTGWRVGVPKLEVVQGDGR